MSEEAGKTRKLIGIWMSEKKFQKLRWPELVTACRNRGYDIVRLDLDKPLDEQGDPTVFIHKLTDIIAAADQGDSKSLEIIDRVKEYIFLHPKMLVIDPLDNVRILLDRYRYYSLIENHPGLKKHNVFTPTFCVLSSSYSLEFTNAQLRQRGVTFPLVCKPTLAHGSKSAHNMCVIFNQQSLAHCKGPCVLQSFINHNAVLYKVFVVGNSYYITERPSLKNFYACDDREPISFHSGDVCKSDSQSTLSILDPHEIDQLDQKKTALDPVRVEAIIDVLQKELQLVLFGIDIVVENTTNQYAIIDVNVYPGYEGYPNFFEHLVNTIDNLVCSKPNLNFVKSTNGLSLMPNGNDENNENIFRSNGFCNLDFFNEHLLVNVDSYCKSILKNVVLNSYDD